MPQGQGRGALWEVELWKILGRERAWTMPRGQAGERGGDTLLAAIADSRGRDERWFGRGTSVIETGHFRLEIETDEEYY